MLGAARTPKFHRHRKSWFGRKKIRERYCPKCDRPYLDTPIPQEDEQLVQGSAVAMIYAMRRWGRKSFVVQFGRCQSNGSRLYLSQLFEETDLPDLARVAANAEQYIRTHTRRG